MGKRNPRPLTPFGTWVKTQSVQKDIALKEVAESLGLCQQNLTAKLHGERHFKDTEIAEIEAIYGEKYSDACSA